MNPKTDHINTEKNYDLINYIEQIKHASHSLLFEYALLIREKGSRIALNCLTLVITRQVKLIYATK